MILTNSSPLWNETALPSGRVRWTMQLLADHLIEVGIVDSISDETVRQT